MAGIEVRALARRYGAREALAGVDFTVGPGEILGLLGPNGAGKTTAIEAIAGLVRPDSGSIRIHGIDAIANGRAARRRLGVVLQESGLPAHIRTLEALRAFATLQRTTADFPALVERFGLAGLENQPVDSLSGGQKQRLALALAFLGEPAAILLDEPTSGLDPQARHAVQQQIAALRDSGCAILLATHDMAEAERLADRVAILDHGRIIASGPPAELVQGGARQVVALVDRPPVDGWPEALPGIGAIVANGHELRFSADDLNAALGALLSWLGVEGMALRSLRAEAPTLEALILALGRP